MKKNYIFVLIIGLLLSISYYSSDLTSVNARLLKRTTAPNLSTTSHSANLDWNITWGTDLIDTCRGIATDNNDNVYITGYTESYAAGMTDVCLIKYDEFGNYEWNSTWGGTQDDFGNALAISPSSYIYVTGYTNSFTLGAEDFCLVKFNESGGVVKNTTYGDILTDRSNALAIDSSSNIYITGYTNNFGAISNNIWLLKYNQNLDFQWNITWELGANERGYDILIDPESNIYVLGTTNIQGGSYPYDICLIKFNSDGDELWNITWGSDGNEYEPSFDQDSSGNIYITGDVYGSGYWDIFVVKFDSLGNYIWNITWGGNSDDNAHEIIMDQQDYIWITGGTNSYGLGFRDVLLMKLDSTSNILWNTTMGWIDNDVGKDLCLDSQNNILIGGYTESYGAGNFDILLLKYISIVTPSPSVIPFGNTYLIFTLISLLSIILILIIGKAKKLKILN